MMRKIALFPLVAALGVTLAMPADAMQRRDEQNAARAQMMAGKVKSIRSIEKRILPKRAGSQYLGPEFDPRAGVYRLKFLKDGRVSYVDVDGRTGAILRQTR